MDNDEKHRLIAQTMNDGTPQAKALGFTTLEIGGGVAILKVPYRPELVGDPDTGVIAGGVVTTLLDQTCGQAVWNALTVPTSIATLDLRIDYMRAAEPGCDVTAHAHCYKLTRTVAFVRAQAYDRDPVRSHRHRPGRLHAGFQRRAQSRGQSQAGPRQGPQGG
jgi:uncharacterized protein (TIGR00369 family)